MNHLPFVYAAYAVGTVVLLWCGLAPLAKKRSAVRDIRRLITIEERSRDADT